MTFNLSCQLKYVFVVLLPLIHGCDESTNLVQLCKENQEICNEFGQDNWCKVERIDIALSRIKVKENQLDADKYKLLLAYEDYITCMALASQIQHVKLKEKTVLRKENLYKAKGNLSILIEQTTDSKHPHLLYYQWSRESNDLALEQFLALEGSSALENATDQYHLATYYVKRDATKTLGLLYHSLELHKPDTELLPEVLQTLTTIFTKKKQYKQAYIWLRAYQLLQDEPNKMIESSLRSYQQAESLNMAFLDDVASSTLEKIEAGEFVSPNY